MNAYRSRASRLHPAPAWRGIAVTLLGLVPWLTLAMLIGCIVGRYIASALI